MITVNDHPEYEEPNYMELILEEDYLPQDMGEVYEELYPRIPDEEFNFFEMEFQSYLRRMIREHEEDDFIQHLINSEVVL